MMQFIFLYHLRSEQTFSYAWNAHHIKCVYYCYILMKTGKCKEISTQPPNNVLKFHENSFCTLKLLHEDGQTYRHGEMRTFILLLQIHEQECDVLTKLDRWFRKIRINLPTLKVINMGSWMLINHYDHYTKKKLQ